MDEKNAKLLTHKFYGHIHDDRATCAPCIAIGYLEALEKGELLARALRRLLTDDRFSWEPGAKALQEWEKGK